MRALVVDDHSVMRAGIRALLEKVDFVDVAWEAGTSAEALELAEANRPDVILMDIELPGGSGITATDEIVRNGWCGKVIIISAHDSQRFVESAMQAGARGYVLKSSPGEEILTALEEVLGGGSFLTPSLAELGSEASGQRSTPSSSPLSLLSPRETQVLVRIAEGLASKQIASQLQVSHRTVETHRTNLMRKLGIRKASELVRLAIREGLISA
jgi:two-component system, NarL family, nitrate/nitrite response regulator NarL